MEVKKLSDEKLLKSISTNTYAAYIYYILGAIVMSFSPISNLFGFIGMVFIMFGLAFVNDINQTKIILEIRGK